MVTVVYLEHISFPYKKNMYQEIAKVKVAYPILEANS